jgi:hypothetical protein
VHRKGEDISIISKDPGRTIPLVDVQIHYQNVFHQPLMQQQSGGDSQVVKNAEPCPIAGKRMVSPPGGVAGQPMFESQLGREDSTANCCAGTFDQGRAPRQTNAPLGFGIQCALAIGLNIISRVNQLQPGLGGLSGLIELMGSDYSILQKQIT